MKITRRQIINLLSESIDEDLQNQIKIKQDLLSTYDRSYIAQAYEICDVAGYDFAELVREMLSEKIDSIEFQDIVTSYADNLLSVFHADKTNFYIEDENLEADVQMEFVFKTVANITKNLEDYYVNLFVAIGQGR
tara:strand:+ start:126 stop:530 length:405 start_codon:yes stop_codon:yes gene_type:complete